ncbi:uncharacterized protein LOC129294208 [Prosopis cineraria]|uniref:uncharacterized protein LOC129294208 n=1 Tax=Prosopis cineraria TaxID=364024 RepID=UPI00240FB094|nr:uncharacterized protein LOC129294208 [Prosopis cineraria]
MDLVKALTLRDSPTSFSHVVPASNFYLLPPSPRNFSFQLWASSFHHISRKSQILCAKKRKSESDLVLEPALVEEMPMNDEEDVLDDFEYEDSGDDGDNFYDEEEYGDGDAELFVGDGGGGGGISLAGTWWDKKALAIAEEVISSFDGELQIYAFKTLVNSTIRVRIERLSNKSGSPSMEDIEAFSTAYRAKLDEAELAKFVPEDISLEVSSPGVERIVRIPNDLDRFKERPMYVKYVSNEDLDVSSAESEGVFNLIAFDLETRCCTWGLADVRANREKAGKGRPLNKKQREWRLSTPFDSLRLVRLYSEM